jgi:hypothetical protein
MLFLSRVLMRMTLLETSDALAQDEGQRRSTISPRCGRLPSRPLDQAPSHGRVRHGRVR